MNDERFGESVVEQAALAWLESLGYVVLHGPDIAAGELSAERDDSGYHDVILERRLKQALERFNTGLPPEAIEDAYRRLTGAAEPSLVTRNHAFHQKLVDGVTVEYTRSDGSIGGALVRVFDFDTPENNDWVAVNQFTIVEGQNTRRPDVLIFVNGLPVALMELKNPADENATIWTAFNQIQTYKAQVPSLFTYNELLIISDGLEARVGSLTADTERFMPWRTIEGEELAPPALPQLQVVIQGLLGKRRLLDFIRYFVVFEDEGDGVLTKKIAGYHQFHAVDRALVATLRASSEVGDRRVGVVWHTQGSGKSLTMAFYAGRLVLEPKLYNPTIVVITDRNDLDDQLFGTFSRCHELLRQAPEQAVDREDLKARLNVSSGHVIFTTIQKFMPAEDMSQWSRATVNIDYHIAFDGNFYSVPYTLVQQVVEVRSTPTTVEIFHKGNRIASHLRSRRRGQAITQNEHRPKSHQAHVEWPPSRMVNWARSIGPNTAQLFERILNEKPHPEMGYRSCLGIIRLAQQYSAQRMEAAAERALLAQACRYQSVKSILKNSLDVVPLSPPQPGSPPLTHDNVRGADYFDQGGPTSC